LPQRRFLGSIPGGRALTHRRSEFCGLHTTDP
jgi:hypothetical protein